MTKNNNKPSRFWHPFANMAVVAGQELVLSRGEGVWVWDLNGQRYLDATAGLWYCFLGHGCAELADAASQQMKKLAGHSTFGDLANEPVLELAGRVADISPIADAVVFFTSGGSESIDTAAKMVRRYWTAVGEPERRLLVTRQGSYHGVAGYGTSLAGIQANTAGYGELIPGIVCIPADDSEALSRVIDEHPGQVAAFFGEPVLGAGGVYPPAPSYWTEIERICRKNDVLLVADEVITGFGRLGTWFGSSRFGIVPDIITGAKGITSGYLPLGVVICGPRVQEPFWKGSGEMFRHGYTYSGHAAACAVGIANLKLMEDRRILDHVSALESTLRSEIQGLLSHKLVKEIRCIGLLAAFELSAEARAANPKVADIVVAEARRYGVIARALVGHSVQISPPLVITAEEIQFMTGAFMATLDNVENEILWAARA